MDKKWIVGIAVVALIVAIAFYWWYSRGKSTPWKCFVTNEQGHSLIARLDAHGDAQCLSKDGKSCMWFKSNEECGEQYVDKMSMPNLKSVTCGDEHKSLYGKTGYEDPNHWCSKVFNAY
jgi:hypothetical protein